MTAERSWMSDVMHRRFSEPLLAHDLPVTPLPLSKNEIANAREILRAQRQTASHMRQAVWISSEPEEGVDPDRLEQVLASELVGTGACGAIDHSTKADHPATVVLPPLEWSGRRSA